MGQSFVHSSSTTDMNKKPKASRTVALLPLFRKFLRESKNGHRVRKNGRRLSNGSIDNYQSVYKLLVMYEQQLGAQILIHYSQSHSIGSNKRISKEWNKLYLGYTGYLYKRGCIDNYVGLHIGILRTFFHWVRNHAYIPIRGFSPIFRKPYEETPVLTISQDRLSLLMNDNWVLLTDPRQRKTRDLLLFGCTTGLRFSDLRNLTKRNIITVGNNVYLTNTSKKTSTSIRIKLPAYCILIVQRYKGDKKLLPYPCLSAFNKNIKKLAELAGWTEVMGKRRHQNNRTIEMKKPRGGPYRFCDLMSSHIMRKTAITTLLMAGVPEHAVRRISGHTSNSKEFQRYVLYSQSFLDAYTDHAFGSINETVNSKSDL